MDNKLYYFTKAVLLCEKQQNGEYFVINGAWSFKLEDDQTTTVMEKKIDLGECEIHTRESFVKAYPHFGY